jgi:hypothetical protein
MVTFRAWLFRGLILIAAAFMVISFILPWWSSYIEELNVIVAKIFPYGLWLNMDEIGGYTYYMPGYQMPGWFTPAMWFYLGMCIVALIFSMFAKEKPIRLGKFNTTLPQFLVGFIGLSYIVVDIVFVIVAAIRTGDFFGGMPLLGEYNIVLQYPLAGVAHSQFEMGFYLSIGVGLLLVILSLLRNKIIVKNN